MNFNTSDKYNVPSIQFEIDQLFLLEIGVKNISMLSVNKFVVHNF